MARTLARALVVSVLAGLAGLADPPATEAGAEVSCDNPMVFRGAAINVVVLQYTSAGPTGPSAVQDGLSDLARKLSRLIQLDSLFSLLRYDEIGVVHLLKEPGRECRPEVVAEMLTGKGPAERQLRPGAGAALLWGRIYEEGDEVFVQSYLNFFRRDVVEEVRVPVSGVEFVGRLPFQSFAFPPRRLTRADLAQIETESSRRAVIREAPDDAAAGRPLELMTPEGRLAYHVVGSSGQWMQVKPFGQERTGWIHAGADTTAWPLRRKLPELNFVDGVAGYLRWRSLSDARAGQPKWSLAGTIWAQKELLAQQRYFRTYEKESAADAGPVPRAMARALSATIDLLARPAGQDTFMQAYKGYGETVRRIPYSAEAWNLKALAGLLLCCVDPAKATTPDDVVEDLLKGVSANPRDRDVLENLEKLYQLLAARSYSGPRGRFTPAELQRRLDQVRAAKPAARAVTQ